MLFGYLRDFFLINCLSINQFLYSSNKSTQLNNIFQTSKHSFKNSFHASFFLVLVRVYNYISLAFLPRNCHVPPISQLGPAKKRRSDFDRLLLSSQIFSAKLKISAYHKDHQSNKKLHCRKSVYSAVISGLINQANQNVSKVRKWFRDSIMKGKIRTSTSVC